MDERWGGLDRAGLAGWPTTCHFRDVAAYQGPAKPPGFVEPCIPTRASKPPVGPQWIHEIMHDGYRLIAQAGRQGASFHTPRLRLDGALSAHQRGRGAAAAGIRD